MPTPAVRSRTQGSSKRSKQTLSTLQTSFQQAMQRAVDDWLWEHEEFFLDMNTLKEKYSSFQKEHQKGQTTEARAYFTRHG